MPLRSSRKKPGIARLFFAFVGAQKCTLAPLNEVIALPFDYRVLGLWSDISGQHQHYEQQ